MSEKNGFYWNVLVSHFVKYYLIASRTGMGLSKHLYAILLSSYNPIDSLKYFIFTHNM